MSEWVSVSLCVCVCCVLTSYQLSGGLSHFIHPVSHQILCHWIYVRVEEVCIIQPTQSHQLPASHDPHMTSCNIVNCVM